MLSLALRPISESRIILSSVLHCKAALSFRGWDQDIKIRGGQQKNIVDASKWQQYHWKLKICNFIAILPNGIYNCMLGIPSNASFKLTSTMRSWLFWCSGTRVGMTGAWKPTEMWLEKPIYGSQSEFKFPMHAVYQQNGMNPYAPYLVLF